MSKKDKQRELIENLFVLELANNHLGSIERGYKIIDEHSAVTKMHNIKAAIKLQIRDVDNFIHKDFLNGDGSRYIEKTLKTKLSFEEYATLVDRIKNRDCIPMATAFDEKSVETCVKLELPVMKIASSDANDWPLIEKIAEHDFPVIVSNGGLSEHDLDKLVDYFNKRDKVLAINHCVSLYPSENHEIELNQIDYLKNRYPDNIIGFSSHEYLDWSKSMLISYAKGARTWERHIDIDFEGIKVSPYNSRPENCNEWYLAYQEAKEMCGSSSISKRLITTKETKYLDELVRGVYAKKDICKGVSIDSKNFNDFFYLSIPLKKGQLSCREIINDTVIIKDIKKDSPLQVEQIDGPLSKNPSIRKLITSRGV
tara:strand:+ start:27 stop:1133 length:1107 start_codon:yes stop_codon:yes gene_type:complete